MDAKYLIWNKRVYVWYTKMSNLVSVGFNQTDGHYLIDSSSDLTLCGGLT